MQNPPTPKIPTSAKLRTACSAPSASRSTSRTRRARAASSSSTPGSKTSTPSSPRSAVNRLFAITRNAPTHDQETVMRLTKQAKLYLCLIMLQIAVVAASAQQSTRTLIRTGHLLDVKTGAEPAAQTIIVTGDRITAIASTASTPKQAGDTEIDLTRYTVMPGLIDVHTHLTMTT